MIESQNPEVNVQELMARVRAEVEKRKALPPTPAGGPLAMPAGATGAAASPFHPLRENVTVALNRARQKNHVSPRIPALIHPFFRNQGGFNLQLLRAIELQAQQLEVLQNELVSIQQASRSEVADLRAALVDSLSQIKALQAETAEQVGALHDILKQQQSAIEQHARQANALQNELAGIQQAGRRDVADLRAALVDSRNQIKALQAGTAKQVDALRGALKDAQVQGDSAQQQLRALESQLVDLADRLMPKSPSPEWDALYLAFENQCRGSRADIKERQRVYLPYLAKAGVGTADKPILDLGCGRGEWLEVLRENGYAARGVYMNVSMASMCRELGLNVLKADAITYLRSLPDQSLGVVTAFHLIEHLPFERLMELLGETHRVLATGGLAIFETPNPESIYVASETFFTDPTHVRPLPSSLIVFLLRHVGFAKTEFLRLHKRSEPDYTGQKYVDELIWRLTMEQDYAVIGSG